MKSHSLDSRRTRGLPGGSYWFGVLGTRGVPARHPKDSLGEALGVGFSGTRGSLELLPDVLSRLKHSGHVALSEGWSDRGFGRGFERRHSAGLRVSSGRVSVGFGDT